MGNEVTSLLADPVPEADESHQAPAAARRGGGSGVRSRGGAGGSGGDYVESPFEDSEEERGEELVDHVLERLRRERAAAVDDDDDDDVDVLGDEDEDDEASVSSSGSSSASSLTLKKQRVKRAKKKSKKKKRKKKHKKKHKKKGASRRKSRQVEEDVDAWEELGWGGEFKPEDESEEEDEVVFISDAALKRRARGRRSSGKARRTSGLLVSAGSTQARQGRRGKRVAGLSDDDEEEDDVSRLPLWQQQEHRFLMELASDITDKDETIFELRERIRQAQALLERERFNREQEVQKIDDLYNTLEHLQEESRYKEEILRLAMDQRNRSLVQADEQVRARRGESEVRVMANMQRVYEFNHLLHEDLSRVGQMTSNLTSRQRQFLLKQGIDAPSARSIQEQAQNLNQLENQLLKLRQHTGITEQAGTLRITAAPHVSPPRQDKPGAASTPYMPMMPAAVSAASGQNSPRAAGKRQHSTPVGQASSAKKARPRSSQSGKATKKEKKDHHKRKKKRKKKKEELVRELQNRKEAKKARKEAKRRRKEQKKQERKKQRERDAAQPQPLEPVPLADPPSSSSSSSSSSPSPSEPVSPIAKSASALLGFDDAPEDDISRMLGLDGDSDGEALLAGDQGADSDGPANESQDTVGDLPITPRKPAPITIPDEHPGPSGPSKRASFPGAFRRPQHRGHTLSAFVDGNLDLLCEDLPSNDLGDFGDGESDREGLPADAFTRYVHEEPVSPIPSQRRNRGVFGNGSRSGSGSSRSDVSPVPSSTPLLRQQQLEQQSPSSPRSPRSPRALPSRRHTFGDTLSVTAARRRRRKKRGHQRGMSVTLSSTDGNTVLLSSGSEMDDEGAHSDDAHSDHSDPGQVEQHFQQSPRETEFTDDIDDYDSQADAEDALPGRPRPSELTRESSAMWLDNAPHHRARAENLSTSPLLEAASPPLSPISRDSPNGGRSPYHQRAISASPLVSPTGSDFEYDFGA